MVSPRVIFPFAKWSWSAKDIQQNVQSTNPDHHYFSIKKAQGFKKYLQTSVKCRAIPKQQKQWTQRQYLIQFKAFAIDVKTSSEGSKGLDQIQYKDKWELTAKEPVEWMDGKVLRRDEGRGILAEPAHRIL